MAREKKEVLPAPPFIPVISRAHRRCVFKEKVSLEELPSAISSLTHLTDMANLFSLQVWAGFGERSRDGNKFVVAKRLVKQVRRNFCTETEDDIVEERSLSNFAGAENEDQRVLVPYLGSLPSVYDRARELFSII
ncbi:uncharacterized protein [Arachis hypogaea]|uniref:uncharacterized protein isoform X1 n=1 Tax=Arachis hypogaea TaxID=3818 RepID=UPI000A2C350C|nr:uncharacterized protein LOC112794918 [Arachis hypogaea]XP_029153711.1 uncharacterized protein LOC112794918 [Arachis hypogaea]